MNIFTRLFTYAFALLLIGIIYIILFCMPVYFLLEALQPLLHIQFTFYESVLLCVLISILKGIPTFEVLIARISDGVEKKSE